jgi:hypothetical protein
LRQHTTGRTAYQNCCGGPLGSYQRSTFIEKGGWDKMPGEEKAGYAVARACADGLDVLMKQ